MSRDLPPDLARRRYQQLAVRSNDVWQGGLVRLPIWLEHPDGAHLPPIRAAGALWTSRRTGLLHLALPEQGETPSPSLLLNTLFAFAQAHARQLGGRPARLEVGDAPLCEALNQSLGLADTSVVAVDELSDLHEALRAIEDQAAQEDDLPTPLPGLLEAGDISPDRLRSFAEAAAAFYRAAPWRHLSNDDVITVHAPEPPVGMAHVVVMGAAEEEYGLSFYESREDYEAVAAGEEPDLANGVTFEPVDGVPFADVDAWEDLDLPVAGPEAYPVPGKFSADGTAERPDARALTFMEAVLHAVATATEEDFDAGRWERTVPTADGDVVVSLSLPHLLEAEAAPPAPGPRASDTDRLQAHISTLLGSQSFESIDDANAFLESARLSGALDLPDEPALPDTPEGRAQALAWQAMDATGRVRVKRARQALAEWEDCADAWCVLADAAPLDEAVSLYQRAVDAGARTLGAQKMRDAAGRFWLVAETRPYMRARLSLAQALHATGRDDEAVAHYDELLRLNPDDNQGARYEFLPLLIAMSRLDEAGRLLSTYGDDDGGAFPFGRALWLFATEGDTAGARAAVKQAAQLNPHVLGLLLDPDAIDDLDEGDLGVGGAGEGSWIVGQLWGALDAVPGSTAWLKRQARTGKAGRRGTSRGSRGRRHKH